MRTGKALISVLCIGLVAMTVGAGTLAYFSDTETSTGNTFTAGNTNIKVDCQDPWTKNYKVRDNSDILLKPGQHGHISFSVENIGTDPTDVWILIKDVVGDENGITESEEEYYDKHGINPPGKNDIYNNISFALIFAGNTIISHGKFHINDIEGKYIYLGRLVPDETQWVITGYLLDADVGNWAQSDEMIFTIELLAQQIEAPSPTPELSGYGRP